jgi:hypothetical protein
MKGLFYSIMIALLIIPILALIIFYSQNITPSNIATNIRANELQYFSESIEEDLPRFLQINGKRALVAAVNFTVTNGIGLKDAQTNLTDIIKHGTLNGTKIFSDQKNLSEWIQGIRDIASRSSFDINLTVLTFDVTQNDSFSVLFNTTVLLNISDTATKMGISKNMSVAAAVSIEGMQDPLYQIKTSGTVFRTIKKSPFNKNTAPLAGVWNLSNLTSAIKDGYYYNSTKGPSFLDRLEGKATLSQPYGLESFVYLPSLINPDTSLSDLDYQYWTNVDGYLLNSSKDYNPALDSIYSWFRIDCSAATDYGISSLLNTAC